MQAPPSNNALRSRARFSRSCKAEDLVQDSVRSLGIKRKTAGSVKTLFLQSTKTQHTWPSFVLLNQLDLFSVALASLHLEDGPANH